MLEVRELRKRYGELQALDGVSFDVEAGQVVGFLGPNGAGKSTTMKIVTGFIPASSGTARVDGFDVTRSPIEVKRRIGYLPESTPLYTDMRVSDYLAFRGRLKGVARRELRKRVDEVMQRTQITDRARQLIGTLSKGYRQRVGIADALVGGPKLLILDEPTIGLDPNQILQVRALVRELAQTHTVLLSTHILPEVEQVCKRVVIISRGKCVENDTVEGLLAKHRANALQVVLATDDLDGAEKAIRALPGVLSAEGAAAVEGGGQSVRVTFEKADDGPRLAEQVAALAAEKGWKLRELTPVRPTLEQIFHRLTQSPEVAA
jgi:ABC-2 type transport system ATP-binding protein